MEGTKYLQKNSFLEQRVREFEEEIQEQQSRTQATLQGVYAPLSLLPSTLGRNPEEVEIASKTLASKKFVEVMQPILHVQSPLRKMLKLLKCPFRILVLEVIVLLVTKLLLTTSGPKISGEIGNAEVGSNPKE